MFVFIKSENIPDADIGMLSRIKVLLGMQRCFSLITGLKVTWARLHLWQLASYHRHRL
jgi:hypothetical protein